MKISYLDCLMHSHYYENDYNYKEAWGKPVEKCDEGLLTDICDYFYARMLKENIINGADPITWAPIITTHKDYGMNLIDKKLPELHETLRNMCSSPLTRGIFGGDLLCDFYRKNEHERSMFVFGIFDKLVSVAEAIGLIPCFNPEDSVFKVLMYKKPEFFLDLIAKAYAFDITAPKYAGDNLGIETEYGLYSQRDMFALHLALTVADKYPDRNIRICEIGGGVGHLAFYLHRLGYRNLTIVDLPTISTLQMYFLGTNLSRYNGITFMPTGEFTGDYDLVINADSFIEMSRESATRYLDLIKRNAKHLISLNQETGPHQFADAGFRVCDITSMQRIVRNMSWIRKGWVYEEYVGDKVSMVKR